MWFRCALLFPLDIVNLGSGFDLFLRDRNGDQLGVVVMAMVWLKFLQRCFDVGWGIGVVLVVVVPSNGLVTEGLHGAGCTVSSVTGNK